MKRLLATIVALGLAGSAAASSIDFTFGTNFYTPADTEEETTNGQNFGVSWNLNSDISLGVYSEAGTLDEGNDDYSIAAIQVAKGVVKRVSVGLNLGSMDIDGDTGALVDVFGTVTILSGSGENIEGSLIAWLAARFSPAETDSGEPADGSNIGLAVRIGF